jgi:hypothetical protein
MDVTDFLHIDDNLKGSKGLSDKEIVLIIKSKNNEPEIDPNEGPLKVILNKEAFIRKFFRMQICADLQFYNFCTIFQ